MNPADQQSAKSPAYPDLPKAITSFGAAVLGDAIYVYGGFEGQAHHYYDQGQSGDLLRLNINADAQPDAKWKTVATGPRLQGLALVASGDSLYRLGGFEARNKESEKQDLWSVPARLRPRFDPKTSAWHEMPPMPRPRSSFDAIAAGDTVYVVGGWIMRGNEDRLAGARPMPSTWRPNRQPRQEYPSRPSSTAPFPWVLFEIASMPLAACSPTAK